MSYASVASSHANPVANTLAPSERTRTARSVTPDIRNSILDLSSYDGTTCGGSEIWKESSSVTYGPAESDSTDLDRVAQLQSHCDPGVVRYDREAKLTPVTGDLAGKSYVVGYIEGIVYKDAAPGSQVLVLTLSTSANPDLVTAFRKAERPIKVGAITLKATFRKDSIAEKQKSMQRKLRHPRSQPIGTLALWVIWEAYNMIERGEILWVEVDREDPQNPPERHYDCRLDTRSRIIKFYRDMEERKEAEEAETDLRVWKLEQDRWWDRSEDSVAGPVSTLALSRLERDRG
jgi:hypothetical protein